MDTISPAVTDAFRLLRIDLYAHLDEAEFLATKFDEWSEQDVDTARELIPDLVVVIRGLIGEHESDRHGECRICASAWPCPVVTKIHALVKDPDSQFVALLRRAIEDA
jgi:hypothetical protein